MHELVMRGIFKLFLFIEFRDLSQHFCTLKNLRRAYHLHRINKFQFNKYKIQCHKVKCYAENYWAAARLFKNNKRIIIAAVILQGWSEGMKL